MKVKCLSKMHITDVTPVLFFPGYIPENEDNFITFSHGDTVKGGVIYPVYVSAEYVVYGIMVYEATLYYLISYEESVPPDWIPSELFETVDNTLPCFWFLNTSFKNNDQVMFIISHYEIATNLNHMLGLLQGNQSDHKKFKTTLLDYY